MAKVDKKTQITNSAHKFPPVVAVLGHVDHGKTTLLDAIRNTSIAARESGGITQKIGASKVEIIHEGKKRAITFIDTPGHEAFSQMRGRGARAADIALLVVASTEGLKPQTKESIEILKKTNTKFIVVLTKIDMPNKNSQKVKQELLKEQITLEEFGGDVPAIEVSAKTNTNIKELLDLILLFFDMNEAALRDESVKPEAVFQAIVIESRLDTRAGPKATIVIKNGTIKARDEVQVDNIKGKVRTILDEHMKQLAQATIGEAVEVLGLEKVPTVGSILAHKNLELIVPEVATPAIPLKKELVYQQKEEEIGISVILAADTQGSLEAISAALPDEVKIIIQKTGDVTEADVLLAKSTSSIMLSFNLKIKPEIAKFALLEKVLLRNYTVIYEMLDEIRDALEGKLQSQMEQIFGRAKVLAKFPFEKTEAYGIKVTEGRIARSDHIRVMRMEDEVGETTLASLRVGKNPISKVEKGHEAGILISTPIDIQVGDVIISHS